jgi:hypothetical protein
VEKRKGRPLQQTRQEGVTDRKPVATDRKGMNDQKAAIVKKEDAND